MHLHVELFSVNFQVHVGSFLSDGPDRSGSAAQTISIALVVQALVVSTRALLLCEVARAVESGKVSEGLPDGLHGDTRIADTASPALVVVAVRVLHLHIGSNVVNRRGGVSNDIGGDGQELVVPHICVSVHVPCLKPVHYLS